MVCAHFLYFSIYIHLQKGRKLSAAAMDRGPRMSPQVQLSKYGECYRGGEIPYTMYFESAFKGVLNLHEIFALSTRRTKEIQL